MCVQCGVLGTGELFHSDVFLLALVKFTVTFTGMYG